MTPVRTVTKSIATRAAPKEVVQRAASPHRRRSDMHFKLIFTLAALFVFALPAWTHHSHGNYEDTFMDIQGVVKEIHLVVPHSWIYVEVKDAKGEPQMWALEA